MSDYEKDRAGGGLAVVILAGFLALLVLLIGGGGFLYLRHVEQQRIAELIMLRELAEYEAQRANAAQAAAMAAANKAQSVIETPVPSAPAAP